MKRIIFKTQILSLVFTILVFVSGCQSNKKEVQENKNNCTIVGTIEGYKGAMISLDYTTYNDILRDTIPFKDGKFSFKRNIKIPTYIEMNLAPVGTSMDDAKSENLCLKFWADKGEVNVLGHMKKINEPIVDGSKIHNDYEQFMKDQKIHQKENNWVEEYTKNLAIKNRTEEVVEDMKRIIIEGRRKEDEWFLKFLKKNPDNLFAAQKVFTKVKYRSDGLPPGQFKKMVDLISPKLNSHQLVIDTKKMLAEMLTVNIDVNKFVGDAPELTYQTDKSYQGGQHEKVSYLSIFPNNDLCALKADFKIAEIHRIMEFKNKGKDNFSVQIISPEGKLKKSFKIETDHVPTALSVDDENNIYVIAAEITKKRAKYKGKMVDFYKIIGANCIVYNTDGKILREFKTEGVKIPTGCRTYKDKLYVSDVRGKQVCVYNKLSGKKILALEELRSCCTILDLDIDEKGNVLVANLGAFQVLGFDNKGKKILAFGKKGKDVNSFSGCCNPVSVSRLKNNCIVTVEKTPTRIKVYSKNGAKVVEGIEELVKDCEHIPVITDSNNNIYLASPEKGIVKCVIK